MRFVTFQIKKDTKVGLELPGKGIIDLAKANKAFPKTMVEVICSYKKILPQLKKIIKQKKIHYTHKQVKILSPIPVPVRDIICVGKNYAEHAKEVQKSSYSTLQSPNTVPEQPIIFTKATTSVIGPNEAIQLKNDPTNSTDYEGELAVIIGKEAKNISQSKAFDIIFGYTILNDVTARKMQNNHKQWFLGKSPDTYCPMGPSIITQDEIKDINKVELKTFVNGEQRQHGIVQDMVFNIPYLIETITKTMTLVPGDIIATGTPSGVGIGFEPAKFLKSGDKVKVEIQPIGKLENIVR